MNYRCDIIVIGDSKYGNEVVKNIATAKLDIKTAFISREFKSTTTHDFLNVEYIEDEVVFIDYKNRLFGCYLKKGDCLFSTHLIIASGIKYAPLMIGDSQVPNVFNTADNIPKQAKNQPAIVLGQKDPDIKLALAAAKKYKHVYLCTKSFNLEATANNLKKLNSTENIAVLPNTSIIDVTVSDGMLKTVNLDNYSSITCSAIFARTDHSPETSFVSEKLINKDTEGYLKTTDILESELVPKCFAIGNCTRKTTKKKIAAMLETILKDF